MNPMYIKIKDQHLNCMHRSSTNARRNCVTAAGQTSSCIIVASLVSPGSSVRRPVCLAFHPRRASNRPFLIHLTCGELMKSSQLMQPTVFFPSPFSFELCDRNLRGRALAEEGLQVIFFGTVFLLCKCGRQGTLPLHSSAS